jgi:2'-5' RNA ligase
MAMALNIRADDASADEIERLWDEVGAFEEEPSMRALGYRPHFTFAIYDSPDVDEKTAWHAMVQASAGQTQLCIEFRRIRWFPGQPLVLWAEPTTDGVLSSMHRLISAAVNPALCRPYYRPGAWTAHCTLGTHIAERRRDDAMAFARSFDRSFQVVFDVIDCVGFPPVRILSEQTLPAAPA